ncbi:sce7726 family protein [Nocardiopsis sp. N85]|uniref:sce7726 family protein n=1 Tax=Nocardiopsis sp. N85 TaxID=3029400 RepID=UPI00237F653F|nr:sce7726 family protein [Nocardiopsis sp. N85]MDE3724763.1 sce7726 family protein [Nocardiopsis sp. N85]
MLTADLNARYAGDSQTLIRHELGLCAGERRVDLAVINGEMVGYEIKSDVDRLDRLPEQAEAYGKVFDRMVIVTTDRYLADAVAMLPTWWEVLCIRQGQKGVSSEQVRAGKPNKGQDPFALAQLLWREEALEELRSRGLARGLSKKRRWIIWQHLAQAVPVAELGDVVRRRLKARREWPVDV